MTPQEDEKKYQIALSLIDGVGDIVGKKLLAQFGSAKGVFFAKRKEFYFLSMRFRVLVSCP